MCCTQGSLRVEVVSSRYFIVPRRLFVLLKAVCLDVGFFKDKFWIEVSISSLVFDFLGRGRWNFLLIAGSIFLK